MLKIFLQKTSTTPVPNLGFYSTELSEIYMLLVKELNILLIYVYINLIEGT